MTLGTLACGGNEIGHELGVPGRPRPTDRGHFLDAGMFEQRSLDLRCFNPVPAHFHLEVLPSEMEQAPIRLHTAQVAGAVDPHVAPFGRRRKLRRGQLGCRQYPEAR